MFDLLFAPAFLIATTTVGLALAVIGLRGRRIDSHPLCQRCGFDLSGKPQDSTVCSECGASLGRPRAIRIGHRQRRSRLLWIASTWLLLAFCADGLHIWQAFWSVHWIEHAPQWWVVRQVHSRDAKARDQAITEAARRDAKGTLSHAREALLVQEAIAHQRDWDDMRVGQYTERIECGKDTHTGEIPPHLDDHLTAVSVLDSVRPRDRIDCFSPSWDSEQRESLTLGRQTLKAKFALRAVRNDKFIANPANRDVDLAASWTMILPPKLSYDPSYRAGVEKSMGECKVQFYKADLGIALVFLSFHKPPINLGWGVSVRCRQSLAMNSSTVRPISLMIPRSVPGLRSCEPCIGMTRRRLSNAR
jgi:hypothetical protein